MGSAQQSFCIWLIYCLHWHRGQIIYICHMNLCSRVHVKETKSRHCTLAGFREWTDPLKSLQSSSITKKLTHSRLHSRYCLVVFVRLTNITWHTLKIHDSYSVHKLVRNSDRYFSCNENSSTPHWWLLVQLFKSFVQLTLFPSGIYITVTRVLAFLIKHTAAECWDVTT